MTTFWMLAVSMTAIALVFTIPPLFRNNRTNRIDRDQLNAEVIKDQMKELRSDLDNGKLDEQAYSAARQDLERELLNDIDVNPATDQPRQRSGRWIAGVLLVFIPGLAFISYQQLGASHIIPALARQPAAQAPKADSSAQQQQHSVDEMIAKLAQRMREQPDNLEGWVMLARSYAMTKRYDEAALAYAQAYRLADDIPQLLTDYADVLVTANGGNFTDQAGELLDKALAVQPDNLKALWLKGHWNFQRADYPAALASWQRVAQLLPPDSEDGAAINQQITLARTRAAQQGIELPAAEPAAVTAQPAVSGSRIEVRVSLDSALAEQAASDDTVFIFARAAQGPKMPLAIVRKQVRDLPVTVTLDDSMAMTPAMVLSKFTEVTVGARVSKSGQAIAQSGDLQGTVTPVATHDNASIELTINTAIP